MVAEFRINADVREVQRMTRHIRNGTQRVIPRALNRTIRQVQSAAVKSIAREIPVKQSRIRRNLRLERATRARFTGAVVARGFPIPIKSFNPRQTAAGVTYRGQMGGRRILRGAFIVPTLGGHVFRRRGTARLPIDKQFGPSVPQVFLQDRTTSAMERTGAQRWPINVQQELDRLFRGFG